MAANPKVICQECRSIIVGEYVQVAVRSDLVQRERERELILLGKWLAQGVLQVCLLPNLYLRYVRVHSQQPSAAYPSQEVITSPMVIPSAPPHVITRAASEHSELGASNAHNTLCLICEPIFLSVVFVCGCLCAYPRTSVLNG
jgi:hypothetical protein